MTWSNRNHKNAPDPPGSASKPTKPNETWQMDYTGWHLRGHRRVYILTILDDHSRYILAVRAFAQATVTNVIDLFTEAGNLHGYQQSTLTDNGRAFTTSTHGPGYARNGFEQILADMGIAKKNGKPCHPQTQGKVERFHQTLKRALRVLPPAESLEEINQSLADIIDYYNTGRWDGPHLSSPIDPAPKPHPHWRPGSVTTGRAPTRSARPARSPCGGTGGLTRKSWTDS